MKGRLLVLILAVPQTIWEAGEDESHKKGNNFSFLDQISIAVCITFIFWEFRGCSDFHGEGKEPGEALLVSQKACE